MMQIHYKKMAEMVRKNRWLRVLLVLGILFLLFTIVFTYYFFIYRNRGEMLYADIEKNKASYTSLEAILNTKEAAPKDSKENYSDKKAFADYEEVVPFISLLESLFSTVDHKAEITVKSREEQILTDHFADYNVNLKITQNKDLFFKALDELYNTRYIAKWMSFNVHYKTLENGTQNDLAEAEFVVRLFLK